LGPVRLRIRRAAGGRLQLHHAAQQLALPLEVADCDLNASLTHDAASLHLTLSTGKVSGKSHVVHASEPVTVRNHLARAASTYNRASHAEPLRLQITIADVDEARDAIHAGQPFAMPYRFAAAHEPIAGRYSAALIHTHRTRLPSE